MSKKKAKKPRDSEIESNKRNSFELNTKAVDDLVQAHLEPEKITNVEQVGKTVDPYKTGLLSKIPVWIKALFIKFWFAGAVCFFFFFGLGNYITNSLDLSVILALAIGIVTDIAVNNIFRFFQSDKKEYEAYMMLPMKKFWTFFVNIIYAFVVLICVMFAYDLINKWIIAAQGLDPLAVPLPVEPLLFGLFYLIFDMAFIGLKDLTVHLIRRNKSKVAE